MKPSAFITHSTIAAAMVVSPRLDAAHPAPPASVPEAAEQIVERLQRQGFELEGVINHSAAAASVGLELLPTQVLFFGSRRKDASLIRRRQTVALDLPIRFLVFEDEAGNIQIETNDIGFLIDRHELPVYDLRLLALDHVLDQFGEADRGIRTIESARSFDETIEALLQDLQVRGFRIPLTIDYSERRRRLRPTTLIMFGNPNVGTPLMQSERSIGLDLPQKMLISADRRGRVSLSYNDPFFLARKHNVLGQEPRLENISNALKAIAETAAGLR